MLILWGKPECSQEYQVTYKSAEMLEASVVVAPAINMG